MHRSRLAKVGDSTCFRAFHQRRSIGEIDPANVLVDQARAAARGLSSLVALVRRGSPPASTSWAARYSRTHERQAIGRDRAANPTPKQGHLGARIPARVTRVGGGHPPCESSDLPIQLAPVTLGTPDARGPHVLSRLRGMGHRHDDPDGRGIRRLRDLPAGVDHSQPATSIATILACAQKDVRPTSLAISRRPLWAGRLHGLVGLRHRRSRLPHGALLGRRGSQSTPHSSRTSRRGTE